jgi:hypothetical protein
MLSLIAGLLLATFIYNRQSAVLSRLTFKKAKPPSANIAFLKYRHISKFNDKLLSG